MQRLTLGRDVGSGARGIPIVARGLPRVGLGNGTARPKLHRVVQTGQGGGGGGITTVGRCLDQQEAVVVAIPAQAAQALLGNSRKVRGEAEYVGH